MKDKLTILLTLLDRPIFTYRWMKYANHINVHYKILIADGGNDKKIEEHLLRKDNYPNLDYEYIRYPFDQSYLHYYKKVLSTLELVKTPYVVLADNDDFFILDGLKKSVNFLEANKDYSSCGGKHYKIHIRSSISDGYYVYGDKIKFIDLGRNKADSVLDSSAVDRVYSFFSNYRNNWYDIHRTKYLKSYWDSIVQINLQNIHVSELIIGGLGASMGKIHRATFPYLILQEKTIGNSGVLYNKQYGGLFGQMFLPSWSEDINNYFRLVTESICKVDDITEEVAREKTINIFKSYLGSRLIQDISRDKGNDLQIYNIEKQNYIYKIINKYKNLFHPQNEPFKIINKYNNRVETNLEPFIDLYSFLKNTHPEKIN